MSTPLTSTGTIFSLVAEEPATLDQAGFEALTFVEVGKVTNVPEYGPNVQVVTLEPLATGITEKYKGFINYGSMSVEAAYLEGDAGQALIDLGVTGANKNKQHSFKIEYQDGSVRYFIGGIFSNTENPGSANSMIMSSVQIELNSPVFKIAAP